MPTRPLVTALVLILAGSIAPSCKADRSKPRIIPADAGAVAATGKGPIASGAGDVGAAGAGGARDGGAGDSAKTEPAEEPKTEPAEEPKTEPAEKPKTEPAEKPKSEPAEKPKTEPPATGDGEEEKKPTNLKVLPKSWSIAQVNDFMKKQVTRGLGVKCGHCHEKDDYASDANEHKKAARSMIAMTNSLNRQYFAGKRTLGCFTCHKGKEAPPKAK